MLNKSITKKQLREFGLILVFFIPIIFGWLVPFLFGHGFKYWTFFVGIPFLFLATIKPNALFYPYKSWMFLGEVLGWVNSRIILGLVFLIILQPIALIMRILGHDPLRTKKFAQKSYRETRTNYNVNLKKIF